MRQLHIAIAAIVMACTAARAQAGEFAQPDGFSFSYPDDWAAYTASNKEEVAKLAVAKGIVVPKTDLKDVSVTVITKPGSYSISPTLRVFVTEGVAKVDEANRVALLKEMSEVYRSTGMNASNITADISQVGGQRAIAVSCDATMGGNPLHQKQLFVPGRGRIYMITCSAASQDWVAAEPAFQQIVASFKALWGMPGGRFTHPDGFSFSYPDGWVAVTSFDKEDAAKRLSACGLSSSKAEFDKVVVIVTTASDSESEVLYLSVSVTGGALKADEANRGALLKQATDEFRSLGVDVSSIAATISKVGTQDAIAISMDYSTGGTPLRARQFHVSGGGKIYSITCGAPQRDWATVEPAFSQMVGSFTVPLDAPAPHTERETSQAVAKVFVYVMEFIVFLFIARKFFMWRRARAR